MLTSQLRQEWRECIPPRLALGTRARPSYPSSPPARSVCVSSVDRANLAAPWSCRREYGFGEDRAAAAALVCRAFHRRTAYREDARVGAGSYNLRDELGEDSGGVATLRQGLTWVDGGKKTVGFGEKHPTQENTVDGMRSQADRRVEVMFFEGGEEPNLAGTNGEDIYDGVTFERRRVEAMRTARRVPYQLYLAVARSPAENPAKFSYRMTEHDTGWEQSRNTDERITISQSLDCVTFRIPPAGVFSLWLMHSGASPFCLMRDVPYERLAAAGPTSAFRETDVGIDDVPAEVLSLHDDYLVMV